MTQAIAANYELAQDFVRSGAWQINLDTGHVLGKRGLPFQRTNSWGYIQIKFRDPGDWRRERAVLAHRVIWEAVNGPVPDSQEINHRNGVKADNRIVNLEAITHLANVQHAHSTGLTTPTRGIRNPNALLSYEDVLRIYQRAWAGEDQAAIGSDYGVGRYAVSNIKRGWSWAHVTGHAPNGRNAR